MCVWGGGLRALLQVDLISDPPPLPTSASKDWPDATPPSASSAGYSSLSPSPSWWPFFLQANEPNSSQLFLLLLSSRYICEQASVLVHILHRESYRERDRERESLVHINWWSLNKLRGLYQCQFLGFATVLWFIILYNHSCVEEPCRKGAQHLPVPFFATSWKSVIISKLKVNN